MIGRPSRGKPRRYNRKVRRIWIRGTSGAGKTTLGLAIAEKLGIPAVDLDDLYWLPEWTPRPRDEFTARVAETVAGEAWVLAGNYTTVLETVVPRADTVVWLDYSLPVTFSRILRRTLRRGIRREPCCNGNRESLLLAFFSKRSILWWCLSTHWRRHRECLAFTTETPPEGQVRLRHRSPRDAEAWLREIA